MSKTNENTITESGKRKGVAVNQTEALDLLRSAVWHCQQNGIAVRFVNKPGVLWLAVPGAELAVVNGDPVVRTIEATSVVEPVVESVEIASQPV